MTLHCLDCGYSWKPRKAITRYRRQCPKCDGYRLEKAEDGKIVEDAKEEGPAQTLADGVAFSSLKWPKVVYDLMGISGASSSENALARAFELYRRALPYKFKHKLESLEKVFKFLENKATSESKKAIETKERLQRILNDPTLIFWRR